jgi:hypothetical protein
MGKFQFKISARKTIGRQDRDDSGDDKIHNDIMGGSGGGSADCVFHRQGL